MRVLILSAPPWAASGYGSQCRANALALKAQGHEVGILAFAGCHEEREWNGIPILSSGHKQYANGVIASQYKRWKADILIPIMDSWGMEPAQLKELNVRPWMPVDCTPLSQLDKMWLSQVPRTRPLAMSSFGAEQIGAFLERDIPVVHHGVDQTVFKSNPALGRIWRHDVGLPEDCFLISIVGVNDESNDRKNFVNQLIAFKRLSERHSDVVMYLHTEPQVPKGINLLRVALDLKLQGKIMFCDEERRARDGFNDSYMAGMFNASQVYTQASKAEGLGIPVLEALSCGTPCIVSKASAQAEVIDGECGLTVAGDKEWCRLHNAWWVNPSSANVFRAFEYMYKYAEGMREGVLECSKKYDITETVKDWKILDG